MKNTKKNEIGTTAPAGTMLNTQSSNSSGITNIVSSSGNLLQDMNN
jgi:hypothetical protein